MHPDSVAARSADGHGTPQDPVEIELKFGLRAGSRRALKSMPEFSASKARQLHLLTTYYDTPDGALRRAGLTLRVRNDGGRRVQTVKTGESGSDVALCRDEWEWPIEQDDPDLGKLAATPRLSAIAQQVEGRLQPIFVTDIRRAVHLLHLDDGSVVEIAFDAGRVKCDGHGEPVDELEMELKKGNAGSLYRLARRLHDRAPLWISPESKAARGWRLRTGQGAPARPASPPDLGPDDDMAAAFRKIARSSLGHLVVNIPPTLRGDAEGLHQMRAALRACRAALEFFAPVLSRRPARRLERKFRRFGRKFGRTRDWDVFCTQTIPAATASLPATLDRIGEQAASARDASHTTLERLLRSPPFTALILSFATQMMDAGAGLFGGPDAGRPFHELAPSLFDRILGKIAKRARNPRSLSANGLHRLRKGLDRLYDDMTFVEALYSKEGLEAYRARCEALQKILGSSNDAVVTRRLIRRLDRGEARRARKPRGPLVSWSKSRRKEALHDLERAIDAFRSAPPFWR